MFKTFVYFQNFKPIFSEWGFGEQMWGRRSDEKWTKINRGKRENNSLYLRFAFLLSRFSSSRIVSGNLRRKREIHLPTSHLTPRKVIPQQNDSYVKGSPSKKRKQQLALASRYHCKKTRGQTLDKLCWRTWRPNVWTNRECTAIKSGLVQ